jgi:hypothetical protein
MANRLESIWDALRNSMNPEEEQANPIGNSYSQGQGYNYPVPNEWGDSYQTTSEPTSLLSQIPESARQSIDLGRPPIVNNDMLPTKGSMDAMDMMAMSPQNMASGASDAAWNSQAEQRTPVEEPGFMSKIGDGISDFWNDEEKMANLAIGLNSMRLNPDANLAKAMQTKIDRLQKTKGNNQTAEELRKMGRVDLADLVEKGVMDGKTAYSLAFKPPSALQEKIDLYTKDPEAWAQMEKAGVVGGSGTTINMGNKADFEFQKYAMKDAQEQITAGTSAQDTLSKLEVLRQLGSNETLNSVPNLARGFIPTGFSASADAYSAQMIATAKSQRQAGEGPMSDKDQELLILMAGPISSDLKARQITQQALADNQKRKVSRSNVARQYMSQQISLQDYHAQMKGLGDQPLLSPELREYIQNLSRAPSYKSLPKEAQGMVTQAQWDAMPHSDKMLFNGSK